MKINKRKWNDYGEMPQANPLRWQLLHREDDGSYTEQSNVLKCKDFFNDVVAFLKCKVHFHKYRFSNDVCINDEGMYILLSGVMDKMTFVHNLVILNEKVQADLGESILFEDVDKDCMLVCLPPSLWDSTYQISLATMLIRCCNYNFLYDTWDDFFGEKAPLNANEVAFTPAAKKLAQSQGFINPRPGEWVYAVGGYNTAKILSLNNTMGGIVHDNGVSAWAMAIEKEAK